MMTAGKLTREQFKVRQLRDYTAIREYLELEGKQKTSADGLFTLETVACLGACGLAPVVTVNDKVHSKMTPELAIELLEELKKEEAAL